MFRNYSRRGCVGVGSGAGVGGGGSFGVGSGGGGSSSNCFALSTSPGHPCPNHGGEIRSDKRAIRKSRNEKQ